MRTVRPLPLFGQFARDTRGAAAAEFVLVIPLMIVLIFATLNISMMLYSVATLNYAAQDAARCRAVRTDVCSDAATTQTYAEGRYAGPDLSPVFTSSIAGSCSTVSASADFNFSTGFNSIPYELTARACYPVQPS